jgi:hypothetical protein
MVSNIHATLRIRVAGWKTVKKVSYPIDSTQPERGQGSAEAEASRLEREQMAHSSRNVDPLVDGRQTVRLMRGVDWTCCAHGRSGARSSHGVCVCVCVCLLLQDLVQSCLHGGGGGILEDMCYERRRAEACVD